NGDIMELSYNGETNQVPVWITAGQAENSVTLPLGYGRSRSGRVGTGSGFDANQLRTASNFWFATGIRPVKSTGHHLLASTQQHHAVESTHGRGIFSEGTEKEFSNDKNFIQQQVEKPEPHQTLYNPEEHLYDGYRWGMSIDLNTCVGCNACISACYAENNI